jgi:glutamate synthase (NADPH/NADH) small chain
LVDRRIEQMTAEGVVFRTGIEIGVTLPMTSLLRDFDAVVLSGGAEWPRDLEVPARGLDGIHFAMDFLTQQNKRIAGDDEPRATAGRGTITAKGNHVVVIGGGDTGSDCIGTSARQGAASIIQLEIMPKPPEREDKALTWPDWPLKLRSSHAHEEGADRDWSVLTKRAIGLSGKVEALECVRVEWVNGRVQEIPGSQFQLKADLVLLAMGFLGPRKPGMVEQSRVALDPRGNVRANTSTSWGQACCRGRCRRGYGVT